MKKSRIILPAIALLAVSGIASVTGTVAWFTASQKTSLSISNIAAINTAGNLTANVTAVNGCTTSSATGFDYALQFKLLRDASFDGTNLYIPVLDGGVVNGYQVTSNTGVTVNAGEVWVAAQWTMNFKVADAPATDTYHLFFDARSAVSKLTGTVPAIGHGFRVAMNGTGVNSLVWAPAASGITTEGSADATTTSTAGDTINSATKNVTGINAVSAQETLVSSTAHYTSADASSTWTSKTDLATFNGGTTGGVTVSFTAYFEGTDTTVVTDNAMAVSAAFGAAMEFYALKA